MSDTIRRGLLLTLPAWAVIATATVYGWIMTPGDARVPVHWNAFGQADGYGRKLEALAIVPVVALALTALFALPLLLDPLRGNIRRSPTPLLAAWVGVVSFMAVVQTVVVLVGAGVVGADGCPARIILLGLSMLLVVIGNVLPKARRNWSVGVRTPWALSSEQSWSKSQRLGGWLLALTGVCGFVAAATAPLAAAFTTVFAGVLVTAAATLVMSYVWWRRDPMRDGG